ncbi:MAG: hypothetical protein IPM61_12055 [Chlorobi bacterium]|nr:MAG: hypothetical protein UZ07_CHB004001765 [Chlorobi bacterium OLB7]MBK8912046.1 hypothetical protein [Chlorobiota bacterium]
MLPSFLRWKPEWKPEWKPKSKPKWNPQSALLLPLLFVACVQQGADVGKKLEINGGDFYYTPNVTEADAWKVVDALTASGFYREGGQTSAQLDRLRSIPHVRLIAQEEMLEGTAILDSVRPLAERVSKKAFGGGKIVVDICNDQFITVQSLTYP